MSQPPDPGFRLLEAAADPTRFDILRRLVARGPTCAGDLADGHELAQSTVSHHLRVLRQSGWLMLERRGTRMWYSVRPEAVEGFADVAEQLQPGRPRRRVAPSGSEPRPEWAPKPRPERAPEPPPMPGPRVTRPSWRQW